MRLQTAGERATPSGDEAYGETRRSQLLLAATIAVVVAGIALRFLTTSELWMDEAIAVTIARLPLDDLIAAVRQDGHAPLYYLLLHGWVQIVGAGDIAVRALSGLMAAACLPLAWAAGRRLGGGQCAWVTLVLLASSPFAIRYASEARMYALVHLLVLVGYLAVRRALQAPSLPRVAAVGLLTGLLTLSHYWSFYLLAAVAALLVALAWRIERRRPALWTLAGMGAGAMMFLPWLPSFAYQMQVSPPNGTSKGPISGAIATLVGFGGVSASAPAKLLSVLIASLAALALLGRSSGKWHIELDLRTRPGARAEAAVAAGTLILALLATVVLQAPYTPRYASVIFPLVVLVTALGARTLAHPTVRYGIVGLAVALGLGEAAKDAVTPRTQAGDAARLIRSRGKPGDVVAYCPDQLGPAMSRLLPSGYRQLTFPASARPDLVDWAGYEQRSRSGDPAALARRAVELAGPNHDIWLVWGDGYLHLEGKCPAVNTALTAARPRSETLVRRNRNSLEKGILEDHNVTRAPPG